MGCPSFSMAKSRFLKSAGGVSWWPSGLRIWCCHCGCSGHCCGLVSIPADQKKKKKKRSEGKEPLSSSLSSAFSLCCFHLVFLSPLLLWRKSIIISQGLQQINVCSVLFTGQAWLISLFLLSTGGHSILRGQFWSPGQKGSPSQTSWT